MSGHRHDAMQANQNLGNSLGARSAVRQTKFFRMYESGNTMKALLGTPNLAWDTNKKPGFAGEFLSFPVDYSIYFGETNWKYLEYLGISWKDP